MSELTLTPALIRAALTTVKYPGFSRDIVSFGLVKNIDVTPDGSVTVDLLVESKNSDVPRYIYENVMGVIKELPGVKKLDVNIEHHAPQQKRKASVNDDPADWKSSVPGVKHVIAVASGKGESARVPFLLISLWLFLVLVTVQVCSIWISMVLPWL